MLSLSIVVFHFQLVFEGLCVLCHALPCTFLFILLVSTVFCPTNLVDQFAFISGSHSHFFFMPMSI